MPVPLAVAAPALLAGGAYLNAKLALGYDWSSVGTGIGAQIRLAIKEKRDRLSLFYVLEEHAQGKLANETFLVFEGRKWTYKEFYEKALKVGTWFKTKYGVKSKEVVAMDFMNGDKFLFMWWGLWSIGAKPAFINYNLTDKALVHCVEVASTRLMVVDPEIQENVTQEVRDSLPGVTFAVYGPELEMEVLATQGVRVDNSELSETLAQHMAMLVYTSGTTGLPKGAIVSWRKVGVSVRLFPGWMGMTKKDTFYTSMPLYHSSASLLGVCTSLQVGATLVVGKKFSTKLFWEDVRAADATIIQYVGETCRYLLSAPPQLDPVTGANLDKANKVRIAFGNGLRPDVWNRFKERFGIESIAEFYAATEGSGAALNFSRNDFSRGAIGRSGAFAQLLFRGCVVELDWETEQPYRDPITGFCCVVPKGTPGEMLYQLDEKDIEKGFQGYFNGKKSTEGKIMRDVLVKGDAYFRTGDVMSQDEEGRTYFKDRIGDTFRWKSENVSTNEVSEALGHHPAVAEANVYGVELPHHDGRAGCVAITLTSSPDEKLLADLADHAHKRLPRFAVPLFLRIGEIERTGTNKQLKHVVRAQGVDPEKTGADELFWLQGGTYTPFKKKDWERLSGGGVRL